MKLPPITAALLAAMLHTPTVVNSQIISQPAVQPRIPKLDLPDFSDSAPQLPNGLSPCAMGHCAPGVPTVRPPVITGGGPTISGGPGGTTTSKPKEDRRSIAVLNSCSEEVSIAVSFLHSAQEWKNAGWWRLKPSMVARLRDKADSLSSANSIIYFFADSKSFRWDGNFKESVGTAVVGMRQATMTIDSDGDWLLELSCKTGA